MQILISYHFYSNLSDIGIISNSYKIINHNFSFPNDFRLPCFSIKFMPLFFMKEKSIQHVVSYSNNEFCIEGTWITGCMNPSKSLYDKNEDIIRSPPIFFHSNIFYLSFYFDTHHDLFKIFIDMENDLTSNFPVTVNLIMKNHKPLNALRFQSQFYFTPQAKHGVATFDKKTCLEVFSDEGFSFDGFFIFQYSFKHKNNSTQSPLKYNFYSQNMGLISRATKYLYKTDNLIGFTNNCKYAGISNQGATCYLNSVLQALFHIPAFRSLVYQIPMTDTDKTKKTMIYNLQKLFAQMENSNTAASTRDLTISFGWTSAESFKQNDAQELLRVFLESLEKKLKNKIKDQNPPEKSTGKPNNSINIQIDNNNDNNNKDQTDNSNKNNDNNNTSDIDEEKNKINLDISDLFKFQVTQTIECPKVSFRNTRDDDYLDLAVEVRGCQDLHQSLKKFTLPEKLDSPYSTDEYGPQQAIMYNRFKTLPKVLFIHLKRFEYRPPNLTERFVSKINSSYQLGNNLTKINDRFEFPINIDLSEFVEQSNKEKNWVYELFGVLVHSGSASFGHYYAYLRPENSNQWFKFNDSIVSQCSEQDAVNNNYGDGSNCASGYMLIYMRKEDLPQLLAETVKPPKDILKEPEPIPVPVPEKPKSAENIINNKTDQKSIENYSQIDNLFYSFNGFGSNLLQVKIITDENLRDGCDECSLAISSLDRNKDGYCKGKSANYLFRDSGIILIRRGATESELFDRVSSFFNQNENDDNNEENANGNRKYPIESLNNKIQFYLDKKSPNKNNEDSIESLSNKIQYYSDRNFTDTSTNNVHKDKNSIKFDLYMMNLTNSEGTITRKLHPTNEQISTFGPNNISIFYRSKEQKIKSSSLNINNYCIDETEEEEDHENEVIKTTTNDDDEYYTILDIDNGFERALKHVLNASCFITSSIKGVVNGATNIISKNIDSIKSINHEKSKNKKKRTKNGDKILLFLKVFDYKKQEIRFLKTRNVYHDDKLSVLFDDAIQFFYPEKQAQSDSIKNNDAIKFYSKKFSTIFEESLPDKTFKENKIYNGCIIIMQDSNKPITISPTKLKCSYPILPSHQNEEKVKKLKTLIEYPPISNSLIDYIDAKYNMCEAIVSSYDNPSDFLFILRYSFNNDVSNLKSIIAKKAGIDAYDPQTNSIVLYTQHLNSEDEPNSSPLTYHSRMTSPLNRLFYRFFADTPEAKIGQMVVVKVWMEDKEMKKVLAPKSGTVNDVVSKIIETESLNCETTDFDISLDKSGAVLCQIPSNFKIFSVTSNCSIHLSRKSEKNDDSKVAKIAVCHTKGIKLFVPFFFEIFEKEEFNETKKRLKIEVKSHQIGKIDAFGVDSYDSYFDSLLISVHRLNKSMYDTMKPIKISESDKLFDIVKEDNTSFLFVELPKEKVEREAEKSIKKNTNVITID